ncbi:MAG: ABC transporter substrate-binding protein [Burkholderiaceae bacterium]
MSGKFLFAVLTAICLFQPVHADEVRIGVVTGISGPIAETAQDILKITRAYLDSVNAQGGINGNRLVLVTKDDQYDPKKTAPLAEEVIATDKVVAIVNSAGTAQTISLIKSRILNKYRVPLVGVYSGSDALRGPGSEEIFHTRATYSQEVMKIAQLASTLGMHRVAVLYQEDAFGEGILQSLQMAEKEYNLQVILKAGYKPGAKDFKAQADAVRAVQPQAIFLMGVPDSAYQFMKVYDAPSGAAQIYALSFVTPRFLADAAGEAKVRGIGISQVVPNPNSEALPLIKDFRALANGPFGNGIATSPVTLEGYLNIRLVVEAIRLAGPNPTGEKVMHSLASMRNHRIGGLPIDFSDMRRSGSSYLDIAVIGRNARLLY